MEGPSSMSPSSDSRVMREKRSGEELVERLEMTSKRMKMLDLDSLLCSEDTGTNYPKSSKNTDANEQEMFQVKEMLVTIVPDVVPGATKIRDMLPPQIQLDLNTEVFSARKSVHDVALACAKDNDKLPPRAKQVVGSRGIGLDLNLEDVCSSVNQNQVYSYRKRNDMKSTDGVSECASSTGPLEEKDPMKVWKEMKQNGFLSSTHGGIPVPKQRARKNKQDVIKKKIELAKREQVDRFTKIAAPSGLLNELNPGIINHVRNSRQVHSIIEALVRSEKLENGHAGSKQSSHLKSGTKEIREEKDTENVNILVKPPSYPYNEDVPRKIVPVNPSNKMSVNPQIRGNSILTNKPISLSSEDRGGDGKLRIAESGPFGRTSCASSFTTTNENKIYALKLSSAQTKASENISSSSEEPINLNSVTSLSVKAATVAFQWLELLHQDIKGRLAALRRSKKRVRAVIHTELPFLISKEFPSNQEHSSVAKDSAAGCSNISVAEMHQARWSALFDQMDKSLYEEEKQLESWLNQVKEMQMHCERGLHHFQWNLPHLYHPGLIGNDPRSQTVDNSERELTITAAAASIYSTCNFLLSMENIMGAEDILAILTVHVGM